MSNTKIEIETTSAINNEENEYLTLVKRIIKSGNLKSDRTGVGTRSLFATQMRFSLRNGQIPLLTTKRIFWRAVCEELFWFIRGSTNANELSNIGIHIWDKNANNQKSNIDGDLGPVYGFQWRHWGAEYIDVNTKYEGIDQLQMVIDKLRNNPNDRRILMTAWNPTDIPKMALPPCHCLVQFYVSNDDELSCQLYQRSGDMGLGVPFNIASYSLLTHMLAHVCNLRPGEFIHTIGDAHVYLNHVDALLKQCERSTRVFPKLRIKVDAENVERLSNIENFKFSDFELLNYNPHSSIKMDMAL